MVLTKLQCTDITTTAVLQESYSQRRFPCPDRVPNMYSSVFFGRYQPESERHPNAELSPSKRAYLEKWLDEVVAVSDVGELIDQGSAANQEVPTDHDSMSINESIDTIDRTPLKPSMLKRQRSPSPQSPDGLREGRNLTRLPPKTDLEAMARAPSKLSPMSKVVE